MGMLELKQIMSTQRGRKQNRGHIQDHNGSIASLAKRNDSPSRKDDNLQGSQSIKYSMPDLPEDIWRHIHSLVPLRDAARAACVSHAFLRSWRCHSDLTFSIETICLKRNPFKRTTDFDLRDYNNKIDHVLTNHSGVGMKKLNLRFGGPSNTKSYDRLNSWLQIAVAPGIEELTLTLSSKSKYNFPWSLLSDRRGDSIRHLQLANCALRPTIELGLRSLTVLYLHEVRITGDELGCLLSNSLALEKLILVYCNDIIRLEIPCLLKRLNHLELFDCSGLQVIENKATNIFTFHFSGNQVQLSIGEFSQVKKMDLNHRCAICYSIDNMPSSVPNLETLTIYSTHEMVNAPMVPSKFLHLKFLSIFLFGRNFNRDYDYLSLSSFLEASPSLETFVLHVSEQAEYDLVIGDHSSLRQMPGHKLDNLKTVKITGFCSTKSLVELTLHILENTTSLECLTLDTAGEGTYRCSDGISNGKCFPLERRIITEAHRAILAAKTYIEGKVPSAVKLNLVEPCSRCYTL